MEPLHPTSTRFRFGQTPRYTYYTLSCASLLFPFTGLRKRQWEEYKWVSSKVDEDWNQGCEELLGYAETDSECAPANVPTEKKQLDLALTVLTRVAAYESLLTKSHETNSAQDAEVSESLVAEYYILRTALVRGGTSHIDATLTLLQAWQQNNLGVAEQMYQKSMASQQLFKPGTAESLADVLYELGKDMLNKQQCSLAIKWLERSYKVLEKQELDRLSIDASELQTSIMQSLIRKRKLQKGLAVLSLYSKAWLGTS
jgi:hypothetical protein